jgi:Tol biopolymer transport system component
MRTTCEKARALNLAFALSTGMLLGLVAAAPFARGSDLPSSSPKIVSVTEATHDGISKINLLSDGSHLYLTEWPAAQVIAKLSLEGANRSVIASPFSNVRLVDLSPDGTKLLVSAIQPGSRGNEFWTLPVGAGSPEKVGDLTGRDAAWSMDGKQIVFGKGPVLSLATSTGKQVTELFSANGPVFAPRFSPDGQRVRFTVSDSEQNATALWEIGRDGSNPHPLLPNWHYASTACCGSWTADGRYYIFQVTQTLPNTTTIITSLWALPDTAKSASERVSDPTPVPLTDGPMSFGNAWPARDNKNIWAIGVQPVVEVVKYDPARRDFVPIVGGISATDLDFSADGKFVAYVAIPEGTLWRCRADGTERRQLTSVPVHAALPRWSPDGKQIAYVSMRPGQRWKLSLISADGGVSREILEDSGSQIDANWSADGTRIMFGDYALDTGGISIRILDLKTHKTTTVPGSEGLFSPRWSPDERYIAAISPGNKTLKLFDYRTEKWWDWLTSAGAVNYPIWSADSQYLFYDDFINDDESIRKVKVGESNAERVFVLGVFERYLGALGPWSGRAADGSWMFVRDRSSQEAYQLSVDLP